MAASNKFVQIPYKILKGLGLLDKSKALLYPKIEELFFLRLLTRTENFTKTMWLGKPIMQNTLDLWTIQETICEIKPALIIETGTNQGGSSYFYGNLFDLMATEGKIITIDVEKLHDLAHPRVEYVIGSSVEKAVVDRVKNAVAKSTGPIMVILDSDHLDSHVRKEMEIYGEFVTLGSFMLVQDGVIDTLPFMADHPGPLKAIRDFLLTHDEFEIDHERCERFLITHHPEGWLRRVK